LLSTVRIFGLKFPFLIHKRNKGHVDVVGDCNFEAACKIKPYEFILYLIKYSKTLVTNQTITDMSEELLDVFPLRHFSLQINFNYLVDRVSASYLMAPYALQCCFLSQYSNDLKIQKKGMEITIPVRISKYSNSDGILKFTVFEPNTIFFEDLLDFVLINCHTRIYPILSLQDRNKIGGLIDPGKEPEEYVEILKKCRLGLGGKVVLYTKDIFNMYNMEYEEEWKIE